jgi:hypothetical protein
MPRLQWTKIKQGYTSNLDPGMLRSQAKVEKMIPRTKKFRIPLMRMNFLLNDASRIKKEDFSITGDIVIMKDVSQEENFEKAAEFH